MFVFHSSTIDAMYLISETGGVFKQNTSLSFFNFSRATLLHTFRFSTAAAVYDVGVS
jgi:hypothetical protein